MIFFTARKFEAKATEMLRSSEVVSLENLKKGYAQLFRVYDTLSRWQQERNAMLLHKVRERIEAQLVAQKKVQYLLHQLQNGNIEKHRQNYEDLHIYFRKLSRDTQQGYYPQIMHIRDRFERGI